MINDEVTYAMAVRAISDTALKPSHNNDYASALRDIIRTYFGNVPETTIGAIIEDVQRLNTDCQYRE